MLRRYVCVRQNDQSDCGAAVLATVARHYRLSIGLESMRRLTGSDRSGTSLLGLVEGAEGLGFAARAAMGSEESLEELPLPAIAHVTNEAGDGHFVVLHRVQRRSVVVADPARGVERLARTDFSKRWTGYVLILVPDPARRESAQGDPATSWGRFLRLLRPHTSLLAEGFFCAVLMTVLGLSTSFFIQHLVDSVLVQHEWRLLDALAIGMLAVITFRTAFGILRRYLLVHVGKKVDLNLISDYARHIIRLPLWVFEMRRIGDLLSRLSDAVKVRDAVSGAALTALVDGTLVIFSGAVMFFYDWSLAVLAIGFALVFAAANLAHHPALRRRSREIMDKSAALQAHLAESITGVDTIKAFGLERRRSDETDQSLVKMVGAFFGHQRLAIRLEALATLTTGVAGIVVLWYGGYLVMDGALTIGQLMFFYSLVGFMLDPLQRLSVVNLQVQDAIVAIDRLYHIMDVEIEQSGASRVPFEAVRERIELRDVTFKYGRRSKVLDRVDVTIPAGSTVAIVGESGSGKSTLLKLLLRFYEPTRGQITIDGVDLKDFDLHSLRSRIGLVSQEPFVFSASIADNIRVGRPSAAMEEIIEVAGLAGLDEFISRLPERYETKLGERGGNLSGGERQRLAIARALLVRPEILIFDEATSHLDTATERAIQQSLKKALAEKTVVLVAHRLSTVRKADIIYVLHEGRIAESGTHSELVRLGGRYAALWKGQTEEAESDKEVRPRLGPREGNRRSVEEDKVHEQR